jgi:Tat protein secretion system quality control protein TatD with DNase activity
MSTDPKSNDSKNEPFPWHLGVYDAHCHPTDIMSSVPTIPNMKTRVLTVMATRAEDQDLVTSTADKHGIKSSDPDQWSREECMIPCFGWHPWFSHTMYVDDEALESTDARKTQEQGNLQGDAKILHYQTILQPSRKDPLSDQDRQTFLSLSDPTPFSAFLAQTRRNLERYPHALVGEIGLDRAFRIPEPWSTSEELWSRRDNGLTPGGREGRRLTPFRCSLQHQKTLFKLQLQLAAALNRGVSVHGVQAHGAVLETLQETWKHHELPVPSKRSRKKRILNDDDDAPVDESPSTTKPYPPRICLHSYSGTPETFTHYLHPSMPARIFASFSTAINLPSANETPASFETMIKTVPDHMLLVESDLHTAGDEMDRRIEDIVRRVCAVKGWGLEHGVKILGRNWRAFALGV